ncbi:MAG: iron-sulfur cluster insertion protein ErpA [Gammaproteobacteria bacterium]|nr:iron-sulfur cluster insertion protein ErpA [Pseudomonadota bacterium]MCH9662425.1 iron-sulfur cluster insertion protein ErpA [Gammaproteobacteria bacterium]
MINQSPNPVQPEQSPVPGPSFSVDADVVFTDSAVGKVSELLVEENNPTLKLRVFISGGGCSGFQYGFTFDDKADDSDFRLTRNDVTLVIDPISYQYLIGAEIDYKDDLQGSQFVIRNPNATTTCGCGSSFSV